MQLHQVRPTHKPKKSKPRIGRGGKRGTYSGRGQKGQKAHAGRRIRPAIYELISRLPKLRGYKNKSIKGKDLVVKIGDLEKLKGNKVNTKSLFEAGLLKRMALKRAMGGIKILDGGEVTKAFEIEGLKVSKVAKEKIEAAGGSIIK